ncbi:MAG TPA: hypothetical protein VI383_01335 [Gemmatimonadales bacterium]|nr:hypothetical protein [Gemmatimonadales bacterium]
MTIRRILAVLVPAALLAGCSRIEFVTGTNFVTGTYSALIFRIQPAGQNEINVLAAGGSLSIVIAADGSTTGGLNIPASVTGGEPFVASMEGTAEIGGLTVQFDQPADTFVRDLTWSRVQSTLVVEDQTVGGATFTITLARLRVD